MANRQKIEDSSILYIEDDEITRQNLSQFLLSQCNVLYTAADGEEGFALFQKHKPEIVITDIEMPTLNGLTLAKKIREISISTQIIIVTAYKNPEYLLEALNLQLVQYLIKPINLEKIVDVLKLAAKHINKKATNTRTFLNDSIYYDSYTKELVVANTIVNLSKYERAMIELLIKKHPAPISYDFINSHIYDYGASQNAIKLLVSSLREKVKKESIVNVPGFGYKLNDRDDV